MKIQISYIKAEEGRAAAVVAALREALPGINPKHRDNHPPRKHIYITTQEPEKNLDFYKGL